MDFEKLRARCGYAEKPLMWKLGFDLACLGLNIEIHKLQVELNTVKAQISALHSALKPTSRHREKGQDDKSEVR